MEIRSLKEKIFCSFSFSLLLLVIRLCITVIFRPASLTWHVSLSFFFKWSQHWATQCVRKCVSVFVERNRIQAKIKESNENGTAQLLFERVRCALIITIIIFTFVHFFVLFCFRCCCYSFAGWFCSHDLISSGLFCLHEICLYLPSSWKVMGGHN